jgi:hypothetical protein
MGTILSNTPTKDDRDPVLSRIRGLLDKKSEGEILLDWNTFEPSTVIKETELKDIHTRLCADLEYADIRHELQQTVSRKRPAMLGMGKDMVFKKILTECQMLQVKTTSGVLVTSKESLRLFLRTTRDDNIVTQIMYCCCKTSPRWKDNLMYNLIDCFGINYDPTTITTHKNRKGNGFLEKIITKALSNVRADLRAVLGRAAKVVKEQRVNRLDNTVSSLNRFFFTQISNPTTSDFVFSFCREKERQR